MQACISLMDNSLRSLLLYTVTRRATLLKTKRDLGHLDFVQRKAWYMLMVIRRIPDMVLRENEIELRDAEKNQFRVRYKENDIYWKTTIDFG